MNKNHYSWNDLESACESIIVSMYKDLWMPDYIVGVARDGLPLATVLSYRISAPLVALGIDFHNQELGCETNCWLADWAFGVTDTSKPGITGARWDPSLRKNILIVNNVNHRETFDWIKKDWQLSCYPNEVDAWNSVWHKSVRFATMIENVSVDFPVDYYWKETSQTKNEIVFPWEKSP